MAFVKVNHQPKGIPEARAVVTVGEGPMGAPQYVLSIFSVDPYRVETRAASLRLTDAERHELIAMLQNPVRA